MNVEHLCMGCMVKTGGSAVCPACGRARGTPPDSVQHLSPGTVLNRKYCVGKVLGQGGFGITYLALDTYLDVKLAIKEYFPRELVSREAGGNNISVHSQTSRGQYNYALEKFLTEARTLARFEGHPNIISVRDYFEANGTAYMVMHYLDGITMKDYLEQRKEPVSFAEGLNVIMPVLDALRAIHEKGILHRDISPDNIFITNKGRIILLDFGAARQAIGEKGKHLSVVLKPGYAPEEQYRSRGMQGPWTDIYAVAATFYRAITGYMPPESLDRLTDDPLVPPSGLGLQLTKAEETALLTALAVRSENRYQEVALFQEALWFGTDEEPVRMQEPESKPPGIPAPCPAREALPEKEAAPPAWNSPASSPPPLPPPATSYHPVSPARRESEPMGTQTGPEQTSVHGDAVDAPFRQETTSDTEERDKGAVAGHTAPVYANAAAAVTGEIRVGRSADNHIILGDDTVSRYHALFSFHGGKWYVTDQNSSHGTYVNLLQVTETTKISPGDTITLSNTNIYYDGVNLISEQGQVLKNLSYYNGTGSVENPAARQASVQRVATAGLPRAKAGLILMVTAGLMGLFLFFLVYYYQDDLFGVTAPVEGDDDYMAGEHDRGLDYSVVTGTIEFNGGTYTGELKDGVPHGYGTLIYPQSDVSPGIITRGVRKYEGQWQDGRKHGEGIMSYPGGTVRKGTWADDVFKGN